LLSFVNALFKKTKDFVLKCERKTSFDKYVWRSCPFFTACYFVPSREDYENSSAGPNFRKDLCPDIGLILGFGGENLKRLFEEILKESEHPLVCGLKTTTEETAWQCRHTR